MTTKAFTRSDTRIQMALSILEMSIRDGSSHDLTDCFRCTPAVLRNLRQGLSNLIQADSPRIFLPSTARRVHQFQAQQRWSWAFASADDEVKAIAESCQALINAGMQGREDEIVILLSARKPKAAFLDPLTEKLTQLNVPFSPPQGVDLTDMDAIRTVYVLLRVARDNETGEADYPAHRDLLSLLSGVGVKTVLKLAEACIQKQQNFHDLVYQQPPPNWLQGKPLTALKRLSAASHAAAAWKTDDTIRVRKAEIRNVLATQIFTSGNQVQPNLAVWDALLEVLPDGMTLGELLDLLSANTESEQETILKLVRERLGIQPGDAAPIKKVRILTMHGSKGLSGKVVFIPFAEQGIIPSRRNLRCCGTAD